MVLAVSIVERGMGKKVVDIYRKNDVKYNVVCMGKGTANSEMLDLFGLEQTDKDIVLSTIEGESLQILQEVEKKMKLNKIGNGLAFTIPIESIGGPMTYKILAGLLGKEER